jgi:hypothetical protein
MRRLHTATAAVAVACMLLVTLTAAGTAGAAAAAPVKPQQQPLEHPKTSRTNTIVSNGRLSLAAASTRDLTDGSPNSNRLSGPILARSQAEFCPTTTMMLTPGVDVDLSLAAKNEGMTYLLPPGTYTINTTITLSTADTVTCYRGTEAAGSSTVRILVDPAITTIQRAITVSGGASLGLQNLLLDGQGATAGVQVDSSTLEVNGVTMQGFNTVFSGAAIFLVSSTASVAGATFRDNTAGNFGGAMSVEVGTATFQQVRAGIAHVNGRQVSALQSLTT